MKVRFVGQEKRVNSFGEFEPGKVYDVSVEVGEKLLQAPNLFVEADAIQPMAKSASQQVLPVDVEESKYDHMHMIELKPMLLERGLEARRGARKVEYIALLVADDREKAAEAVVGETNNQEDNGNDGDTETTNISDSEE